MFGGNAKASWIQTWHDQRFFNRLLTKLKSRGEQSQAFKKGGASHYNVGNDLYSRMLDSRMMYSCAYWNKPGLSLEEAQVAKLDLICRKVIPDFRELSRNFEPSGEKYAGSTESKKAIRDPKKLKILEIGCGWGGFAEYAATTYGAEVTGVTVSKEQAKLARERCKNLSAEIKLMDYRDLTDQYDVIVSIGMFEHVGRAHYKTFFKTVERVLKPGGLFLLHTIINDHSKSGFDPFLDKYIFPGAELPSVADMLEASDGLLRAEDIHLLGSEHYEQTLLEWHKRLMMNWPEISKLGNYDDRFRRMFEYYLLTCAGAFRSRVIDVAQIVFSKNFPGRYQQMR